MRCKHCGNKMIFPDTNHKHFSTGKAVAGVVAFGFLGAAAGFVGKEIKGYRCSCCGMFSEDTMSVAEETLVDVAVREARSTGKSVSYERYREKYLGIEQIATVGYTSENSVVIQYNDQFPEADGVGDKNSEENTSYETIKNRHAIKQYVKGCPVYVEEAIIKDKDSSNVLSLVVRNVSAKILRSLYLQVKVYDDAGDLISERSCVYQGLSVNTSEYLPKEKEFDLQTEVAYKVAVDCEKAAFTDDSVWRKPENAEKCTLPESIEITPQDFPQYKYLRILVSEKSRLSAETPLYHPAYTEDCGICICGAPICSTAPCPVCGLTLEGVLEVFDYDALTECRRKQIKTKALNRSKELKVLLDNAIKEKYDKALSLMTNATSAEDYESAAELFGAIQDYNYKDAKALVKKCRQKATDFRKDVIYYVGIKYMEDPLQRKEQYISAIEQFQKIPRWRDVAEQIYICEERIRAIQEREEQEYIARIQQADRDVKRKKVVVLIAALVCVIALSLSCFAIIYVIPNAKYQEAKNLIQAEEYDKAYDILLELDFKDSADIAKEIEVKALAQKAVCAPVGSVVQFGQNNGEKISWVVLKSTDNKALVIAAEILTQQQYHSENATVTWETCDLRKWLNETYLNQIFNEEELSYIATTTLYQDSSPKYGTPGGSATNDQLFLLSVSEYQNYRNYIPLIPKQGDTFLGTWWWLRAPVTLKIFEINGQSDDWYYGVVIDHEGEIKESVGGCDPDGKEGVRPAMWIELPS